MKKIRLIALFLILISLSLLFTGCGNEDQTKKGDGNSEIVLSTNKVTISIDETYQLAASLNEKYKDSIVFWSSGDESVAIVDDSGLVKGISTGETIIYAQCGKVKAICKVNVSAAEAADCLSVVLPSSIDKDSIQIMTGGSYLLPLIVKFGSDDLDSDKYTIDYEGYDSLIIGFDGLTLKGLASGSSDALVTVSYKDQKAYLKITVFVY